MPAGSNTSSCPPYDSNDYANVAAASAVSALVSLVAGTFVISVIMLLEKWRYFSQRLILYLAIAAILTSVSTILHRVDYDNQTSSFYRRFCAMGGFLEQITSWIFLNANSAITVYLFANVVAKVNTERLEPLYLAFIFFFPFTFNWIPFIKSSYGRSGAWCWIRSDDTDTCESYAFGQYLIFVLWYVPLYITLFILISLYLVILVRLHRASKEWTRNPTKEARKLQKKSQHDVLPLMAYPLIYFGLSVPPLVNRIYTLVNPGSPELILWYISALSFPLEGGLIAVAYTLDPGTRKRLTWKHIRAALGRCVSRRGRKDGIMEYPIEHVPDESIALPAQDNHKDCTGDYVLIASSGHPSNGTALMPEVAPQHIHKTIQEV